MITDENMLHPDFKYTVDEETGEINLVYQILDNQVYFELNDDWNEKKGDVTYYLIVVGEGGAGY